MFNRKTVLITGAAVGIGRACALQFARQGANVVLTDINADTLAETERELQTITENVLALVCDIADNDAVCRAVDTAMSRFGTIDILVNNAALWRSFSPFHQTDLAVWETFMNVNVMGTVHVTHAVIPQMIQNRFGRIINVASVAGVYGIADMTHYSATKGAVIAFTKALAKEVAPYGVTVNAISPGTVSTAEERDIDFVAPNDMCYTGRSGSARENADLICFLAGDGAAYINGENIIIDGSRKQI